MQYKIMLDAGHYGKRNQSPAVPEYYESIQMWRLHLLLKRELEGYGFTVDTTRDVQEKDLAVVKRGEKSSGYDLFLSLHSNAVGSGGEAVDRVDVYAPIDNRNNADELGLTLVKAVAECMGVTVGKCKTRKGKNGEYYGVLRGASNVGCPLYYIIEHSFHTNERAAKWLLDEENLARLARVEAAVIAIYFGIKREYPLGDVDMNGVLDVYDIALIKRAYFGTVKLTDEQKRLADINTDGVIDVFDYLEATKRYMN
ncbi:MAG: N-acetylmuramoyl-L-alanine amidase [Clostridia bacterium]|nr:N-acetylmuramoyl-L-alanine amidase [Clostridia bacterium]